MIYAGIINVILFGRQILYALVRLAFLVTKVDSPAVKNGSPGVRLVLFSTLTPPVIQHAAVPINRS